MKKCYRCEQIKELSEFHNDKKFKDGKATTCKQCRKVDAKKTYEKTTVEYRIYHRAMHRAKVKGLPFNLELEDIVIPEYCPIFRTKMDTPSIDQIKPAKGYTKDNIQIVSNRANVLKNNATIEELELILQHLKLH